jgi:transcriptional regulator
MRHGMSQLEVAKELGLSRARVGQIERKALWKLKRSGKLDKFLDLLDAPIESYYGEEFLAVKQESGE